MKFGLPILLLIPSLALAAASKSDHPVQGQAVTLAGEIVSLRCLSLDPEKGRGQDHAKCAEAALRRGEPAGFLSGDVLYLLLGVSDPSVKPVLLASVREQVSISGSVVAGAGLPGLNVASVKSFGAALKPEKAEKKPTGKSGLKKD